MASLWDMGSKVLWEWACLVVSSDMMLPLIPVREAVGQLLICARPRDRSQRLGYALFPLLGQRWQQSSLPGIAGHLLVSLGGVQWLQEGSSATDRLGHLEASSNLLCHLPLVEGGL